MEALLLAAGMGTRLGELTNALPKTLLEINNRPILSHIFSTFDQTPAITKVTVVTGFERGMILDFLGKVKTRLTIEEVWNKDFKKGNFYSVETGIDHVKPPFFITNADHVFPSSLLTKTFQNFSHVSAVCDFDRELTPDCMKVLCSDTTGKLRVKKIHKKLEEYNAGYIGMTVVAPDGYDAYMQAFKKIRNENEPNAYAEQVLQELAMKQSSSPIILDASGFGWLEIDTLEDLNSAKETVNLHPEFFRIGRR